MSKFTEFYTRLFENTNARRELWDILKDKPIEQADEAELKQICFLAEKLGIDISADEARRFFQESETVLDDEELDAIAGGKGNEVRFHVINCEIGGSPEANK